MYKATLLWLRAAGGGWEEIKQMRGGDKDRYKDRAFKEDTCTMVLSHLR